MLYFTFKVEGNEDHHGKVVKALQDMFELVTGNMMLNGSRFDASQDIFRSQIILFHLLNYFLVYEGYWIHFTP